MNRNGVVCWKADLLDEVPHAMHCHNARCASRVKRVTNRMHLYCTLCMAYTLLENPQTSSSEQKWLPSLAVASSVVVQRGLHGVSECTIVFPYN
jgi:hypothetical protein